MLEKELNATLLAKAALTKQLDDAEDDLEQMETAARQKVIRSA